MKLVIIDVPSIKNDYAIPPKLKKENKKGWSLCSIPWVSKCSQQLRFFFEVRLPTNHLSRNPQKWKFCAIGTTFFRVLASSLWSHFIYILQVYTIIKFLGLIFMRAKLKTSEFFSKLVVLTHDKGMISQTLNYLSLQESYHPINRFA